MNLFKNLLVIISIIICLSASAQEMIISNAAFLNIAPGAMLELKNGMRLVNNSPGTVLGGNFVFRGTLAQEIAGSEPFTIANLSIEDGAFVNIKNNVIIGSALNLNSGIINLLDKNLRIANGAVINGTYSETSMIAAEGTGELEMGISGNGTYDFPVGDTSAADEYTPVRLILNSGTYADAVIGVNLKNLKHPNNSSTVNYINRYWSISQAGMSDFSCNLELNYTNSDIVGSETGMIGGQWNGTSWSPLNPLSLNQITGVVESFSEFTGGENAVLKSEQITNEEAVEIRIEGKIVKLKSDNRFPVEKIEIFNRLGQQINIIKPANALYQEFFINEKSDFYLLRISSTDKSITKKVYIW